MSRWFSLRLALAGLLAAASAVSSIAQQPYPAPVYPAPVAAPVAVPQQPTTTTLIVTQQPGQLLRIDPFDGFTVNSNAEQLGIIIAAVEGVGPALRQTWDSMVAQQAPFSAAAVKHTTEDGEFFFEIVLPGNAPRAGCPATRVAACNVMGCPAPQCPPATCTVNAVEPDCCYVPGSGVRAVVMTTPVLAPRLSGTWFREAPGSVCAISFRNDELKVTQTINANGTVATLTLTADYAVTKDGTVHGVVTGADVNVGAGTDPTSMDLAGLSLQVQAVVDQPFALRCRTTDGGLMLSNIRIACRSDVCTEEMLSPGIYKSTCCAKVPTPKAVMMPRDVPVMNVMVPCPPCYPRVLNVQRAFPNPYAMNSPNGPAVVWEPACPQQVYDPAPVQTCLPPPCPQPVQSVAYAVPPMLPPAPYEAEVECRTYVGEYCNVAKNLCTAAPTSLQPVKLTLKDVVDLAQAGVSEDVIANQLRNTNSTFELSVADIKYLKSNGVQDRVIIVLQKSSTAEYAPVPYGYVR